jgi:predicted enzyme related to lactoylglutathione lyase
MCLRCALVTLLALAAITHCGDLAARQSPPSSKGEDKPRAADDGAKKSKQLRQPGFLFLELDCRDLADHISFFKDVAGFEVERKTGNFVVLLSARGEILLNGVGGEGKPVRYQGPRVEIGIVVEDLDKAFEQAKNHKGWSIAAGIARQSWGVRDFRVYSPEGYYLRITEGPK